MKDRVSALVQLLFDNGASITERDEAAVSLSEFSDIQATTALLSKTKDLNEDELILNSCGESLGIIWTKQNYFDKKEYRNLAGTARYGVYVIIKSRKPEWIEQYQLEKDNF
jgi:ankyrin repeat protein